jgi:hypothetical protein
MPRLPKEVFTKTTRKIIDVEKTITNKKDIKHYYLVYAFVGVMIIELLSLFLSYSDNYLTFWYPLLTQLTVLIILLNLVLNTKKLRFCYRKKTALYVLSGYYLFNIMAVIFNIGDFAYSIIVNVLVVIACSLLFITSIIKEK